MMKRFLLGLLLSLWTTLALAGVNCTMPFTFIPGTLADADQVNANFAAAVACFLNSAGAGNNNDITALLALTTPLAPAQGGSSIYIGGTSTGSANVQVVASPAPTGFTLTRGLSILFTAGFTNTGTTTLTVNGTAATNLFRQSPSGPQALTGGEVVLGDLTWAVYDGTQFQLVNSGSQYGGFGPLTSLASAAPDLGTIPSHNIAFVENAGSPITAFGSTASTTFPVYRITFSTALVLTHNGTSLILPSAANITTASGDTAIAMYLGAGNWQVISYSRSNGTSVVSPTPLCGFSGLQISTTSDTQIGWSFNNSNLLTTGNVPLYSGAKSGSINVTTGTGGTSTAGGMDGTAPTNNAFIYLYAISDGSVWSAVGSNTVPATFLGAPNFPTNYRYICHMGAMKAKDNTHVYGTVISGKEAAYVSGGGSNTTLPLITNGIQGSANCATAAPTYTAFTVRGSSGVGVWMPVTATAGDFVLTDNFAGGGAANVLLAPNTSYGGLGGTQVNPAPLSVSATLAVGSTKGRLMFEANTVQYCSTTAQGAALAYGWRDAVNAN